MNQKLFLVTILITLGFTNIVGAQECSVVIKSNDAMQFDLKEIRVSADCETLTVTLKHVGNLPAQFMGHNWVLSTTEDMMPLSGAAMQAGAPSYLPERDSRIIAATDMIGGGQETSVTFDVSSLDPSGDYTYFCAFPGHYAIMKGKFIIESPMRIQKPKKIQKEKSVDNGEMLQASSGTGFAVSYDGHIITNHHVIDACQEVKVRYNSDDILAKLIAFDTVNDLAILKIDTKPSSVLPISYSNPEILQEIYVAGFPFGEKFSTSIKMTKGIVSSLTGIGNNYSNIQIDAALQPGNSGGPVFDDKGNVVGVAVAKIDLEYAIKELGVVPENTNFGIKSSVVINFLESNSIGNLASPLNYKASMTSLGKSVTDATYYVSCMMTMAQIRKVQDQKVIYSELIK